MRGFQDSVKPTPAFGNLNNMLLISHLWFEMNYLNKYFNLISNSFPTEKHLMAVPSSTNLLQESYFFLQLLYPCFVLSIIRIFLLLC